jgi:acyl-homoserine-lactone acylase
LPVIRPRPNEIPMGVIASRNARADNQRGKAMRQLFFAVLFILLVPAGAYAQSHKPNGGGSRAEILWDTWGVPHIFAKDTNSAARALGWAQMQNHGNRLLRAIAIARGRGAEYFGQELLDSDDFTRTMGTYAISQRWRAQQNPEFASYLEAFVAGINDYARQYPEQLTAQARAVLPVESVDVIAAGTRLLTRFVATAGRCTSVFVGHTNGWAIGPSRSASGHAMALENEQVPWDLEWATFFEVQMVSPEFDLYGGTTVGLPVFASMFSPYAGWSLPVNTIDACDLYELTPDADGYRFDGAKRTFSIQKEIIKVRNQDGTFLEVPWEIRRAVQGPVVQNGSKLFAIRLAGLEVSSMAGALEQLSAMARARNLIEFQAAMQRMQVPLWNVIYADRDGHIFELYNGHVPVRPNYDMQFWSKPVPGDTSALVWNQIHPYADLPNVVDPPSGWVQSSNGPPWFMTFPFGDPKNYAPYAAPPAWMTGGLVGTSPQALLSPREQSGLRMLMQGGKISLEKLVEDKYSTRSQMADRVLDDLINVANQSGSDTTKLAAKTLQAWDRKADAESRGAALFEFWAEEMRRRGFPGFYAEPFDLHRPLETPRGLSEPKAASEALDVAAQKLIKAAGRLDVPWGDLYRLRRGKIDLPASGAGDLLGSFRVLEYEATKDGRFTAIGVDNFIAAVEFSTPIRAKVLLTSGNSSDPNSPHYGDQLVLSAKKQLRDAWLTRSEVEQHLEQRTVFNHDGTVTSIPPLR